MSLILMIVAPVAALGSIAFLLRPWQWIVLRAVLAHPPLEPYVPRRWWEDGALRFLRRAWKALLAVQALFLSALVAADLREVTGKQLVLRWYGAMGTALATVLATLVVGMVFGAALQIWRITNEPLWRHVRRSPWSCLAPAFGLAWAAFVAWAAAVT